LKKNYLYISSYSFSSITLQIGRGVKPKVPVQSKLKTDFYRLKPADELAGDIKRADLGTFLLTFQFLIADFYEAGKLVFRHLSYV
jgi:hypothetical protein